MKNLVEKVVGNFEDKKRWHEYKARVKAMPEAYRTAAGALERYVMYRGGITKGDVMVHMLEDLADLFEGAAADGVPVRAVVGENPVDFAEEFLDNYADAQWIRGERERLASAINKAESAQLNAPEEES